MYSENSFFPMIGVGVFYIMFWIGFVVGHNIGLTCDAMLLNALLFGGIGSYAVVKLERLSKGEFRSRKAQTKPAADNSERSTKPALQT